MSYKEEISKNEVVKKDEYGNEYVDRVNFCPVCGKPDGLYKHLTGGAVYMCGRYQSQCKKCGEEGWKYVFGTGAPASLSYMGKSVDLRNVSEPYKENVKRHHFY